MTDEARAVTEVAKTAGEIVKAAGGFGAYLAKVVGSVPEDLLGLGVGDWLHHKRLRHIAVLEDNTARLIESIAAAHPERLSEPSPSVLIPLLQAAVDEGRPELQALWAALLANAMLDGGKKVRRDYFEAVRQMEPVDALVLDVIARRLNPRATEDVTLWQMENDFIDRERVKLAILPDDMVIARRKLAKLDCIENWEGRRPPDLTAFGRGLLAACRPP
jgi:hypothetical protein